MSQVVRLRTWRAAVAAALLVAAGSAAGPETYAPPRFHMAWGAGEAGNQLGYYNHPSGIALFKDPAGRHTLVLVDTRNNLMRWETALGQFQQKFGREGTGPGQFRSPSGVAVDPQGFAYVCDTGNDRVQKIQVWTSKLTDIPGKCHALIGTSGERPGQLRGPRGAALDADGNVYVADTGNHRIQVFDGSGKYLTGWGREGTEPGQFLRPAGIAVAGTSLVVTDSGNHRVQQFDLKGKHLRTWGSAGAGEGQFRNPRGIAVGPDREVYVVDTDNHRVQVFKPEGTYVGQFGQKGVAGGEFFSPHGITCDAAGAVYVTDEGNHRIQRFRPAGR